MIRLAITFAITLVLVTLVVLTGVIGARADRLDITSLQAQDVRDLVADLQDGSWEVRHAGAGLLGRIGPTARDAVPALIEALTRDESAAVRQAAAEALEEIGAASQDVVSALSEALQDEDAHVRRAAGEALLKLSG